MTGKTSQNPITQPSPDPGAARDGKLMVACGVIGSSRSVFLAGGADMADDAPFPFDTLEAAFTALTRGPAPLALDGRHVGHGLPARPLALDELRRLLLDPSLGFAARDAALAALVDRAKTHGGHATIGLAGVLLPGLRRATAPLALANPRLIWDRQAEALAGLLAARAAAPPGRPSRLRAGPRRPRRRAVSRGRRAGRGDPHRPGAPGGPRPRAGCALQDAGQAPRPGRAGAGRVACSRSAVEFRGPDPGFGSDGCSWRAPDEPDTGCAAVALTPPRGGKAPAAQRATSHPPPVRATKPPTRPSTPAHSPWRPSCPRTSPACSPAWPARPPRRHPAWPWPRSWRKPPTRPCRA